MPLSSPRRRMYPLRWSSSVQGCSRSDGIIAESRSRRKSARVDEMLSCTSFKTCRARSRAVDPAPVRPSCLS